MKLLWKLILVFWDNIFSIWFDQLLIWFDQFINYTQIITRTINFFNFIKKIIILTKNILWDLLMLNNETEVFLRVLCTGERFWYKTTYYESWLSLWFFIYLLDICFICIIFYIAIKLFQNWYSIYIDKIYERNAYYSNIKFENNIVWMVNFKEQFTTTYINIYKSQNMWYNDDYQDLYMYKNKDFDVWGDIDYRIKIDSLRDDYLDVDLLMTKLIEEDKGKWIHSYSPVIKLS